MTTQITLEPALKAVLTQLISDLSGLETQYMVAANYYEHQTENRLGERWYIAQIWLHPDSVWNLVVGEQGLLCDVKLNRNNLSQVSRILLPYSEIWKIQKNDDGLFTDADNVYYRIDKLNLSRPGEK